MGAVMSQPCVIWNGPIDKGGYARIWIGAQSRYVLASKHFWELAKGRKVPKGKCLMKTCRENACIEPTHRKPVTRAELILNRTKFSSTKGRRNGRNKLTEDQVIQIHYRAMNGESLRRLGAEFGVSCGTVRDIKSGRIWGWLTG